MAKYKIEKTTNTKLWNDLVDKSPEGSIYCKTEFIECIDVNCTYFLVMKGEEIVGAAYMIEDENGRPLKNLPFVQYRNFILFGVNTNVMEHKRISEQFKISELLIKEIVDTYGEYNPVLSPNFSDIRPFSWYNYHNPSNGTFTTANRYTSILSKVSREEYILQLRGSRRQELKKAIDVEIVEYDDIQVLNEMHENTFKRQNLERSELDEKFLVSIGKAALDNDFGKLLVAKIEGKPVSAVLILFDKNSAYYQFGATDSDFRNTGASTKLLFEAVLYAFEKLKVNKFDFVGVNSPNRGDFKLSFNGELRPYFELNLVN